MLRILLTGLLLSIGGLQVAAQEAKPPTSAISTGMARRIWPASVIPTPASEQAGYRPSISGSSEPKSGVVEEMKTVEQEITARTETA
jgi:hypothetical protein